MAVPGNALALLALRSLGQHVWLDNLSRTLLQEGMLRRLMTEDGIDGVTSNHVGETLQVEGVRLFAEAYAKLLAAVS